MQKIHSDEVVVGGEEEWKGLMEIDVECKRVRRSSPEERFERDAWNCTLQDHRERAQFSNNPAATPQSRFQRSNFHTRLETSFRSSPRPQHPSMNGVEGISNLEDFSGQVRSQLQDQSIDLWERFIFGSDSLNSTSIYSR